MSWWRSSRFSAATMACGAKNRRTAATTLRRRSITERYSAAAVWHVHPFAFAGPRAEFLRRTGLQWDGDDAWMILPDTLAPLTDGGATMYSLDQPRFHDDHAYVTAGVLVARLPEALWPASMPAAPSALAPVEQLVLAGNLVRVGPRWELQHLVIGLRDRIQTLISLDARLVLSGSQPVCQSATEYQGTKSRLCSFVDVASGPDSPTSPCDSLSAGSVMDAKQVVLGGIGPSAESLPAVCPPEVDHDSCDAAAP